MNIYSLKPKLFSAAIAAFTPNFFLPPSTPFQARALYCLGASFGGVALAYTKEALYDVRKALGYYQKINKKPDKSLILRQTLPYLLHNTLNDELRGKGNLEKVILDFRYAIPDKLSLNKEPYNETVERRNQLYSLASSLQKALIQPSQAILSELQENLKNLTSAYYNKYPPLNLEYFRGLNYVGQTLCLVAQKAPVNEIDLSIENAEKEFISLREKPSQAHPEVDYYLAFFSILKSNYSGAAENFQAAESKYKGYNPFYEFKRWKVIASNLGAMNKNSSPS